MKIVIFGAAGGAGRLLVEQALDQGHSVAGFDRHTQALTWCYPHLTIMQGDMFDSVAVEAAIKGQEAVFCVLGVKPGVIIPVCSVGTKNIILAIQKQGMKRFICQPSFAVAGNGARFPGLSHSRCRSSRRREPCSWIMYARKSSSGRAAWTTCVKRMHKLLGRSLVGRPRPRR
jgi:nucleoside-diphosphate-sugar epimerase